MLTDSLTINTKTQILCVYKTGGPYTDEYVLRLLEGVQRYSTENISFLCLTDDEAFISKKVCKTKKLKHGWPGWWSKIELFRQDLPKIPSVYFDLDTIIKGNIDALTQQAHSHSFIVLRGFSNKFRKPGSLNFASGIMAGSFWEYSPVYELFLEDPERFMTIKQENWMHGDQGFIASVIGVDNVPRLQEHLQENYIVGKRIIHLANKIPDEASVIAWSGEPRLHELNNGNDIIHQELSSLWNGYRWHK